MSTTTESLQASIEKSTSVEEFTSALEKLPMEFKEEKLLKATKTRDLIISKATELLKQLLVLDNKNNNQQEQQTSQAKEIENNDDDNEQDEEDEEVDDYNKILLAVARIIFGGWLLVPAEEAEKKYSLDKFCGKKEDCHDHDHDHDHEENDDETEEDVKRRFQHMSLMMNSSASSSSSPIIDFIFNFVFASSQTKPGVLNAICEIIIDTLEGGFIFDMAQELFASSDDNFSPSSLFPLTFDHAKILSEKLLETSSSPNQDDDSVEIFSSLCELCSRICTKNNKDAIFVFASQEIVETFVTIFQRIFEKVGNQENDSEDDDEQDENENDSRIQCSFFQLIIALTSSPSTRSFFVANKEFLHFLAEFTSRPLPLQLFERVAILLNNLTWDCPKMIEFCLTEKLKFGETNEEIFFIDVILEQLYNIFNILNTDDGDGEDHIAWLFSTLGNLCLFDPQGCAKTRLLKEFTIEGKMATGKMLKLYESSILDLVGVATRINTEWFFCQVISGTENSQELYDNFHIPFAVMKKDKMMLSDVMGMLNFMRRGVEATPNEIKQYQTPEFIRGFKEVFGQEKFLSRDARIKEDFDFLIGKMMM